MKNAANIEVKVDQCQRDNFQAEGLRHEARYRLDQFSEIAGTDQSQVECLMTLHDLLIDVCLLKQVLHFGMQLLIFFNQCIGIDSAIHVVPVLQPLTPTSDHHTDAPLLLCTVP